MNCRDVAQLAGAYLDANPDALGSAALAPLERRQVASHLERCAACRRHVERLSRMEEGDLPLSVQLKIQDRLDPATLQRLAERRSPQRPAASPTSTSLRRAFRPYLVALAALAAGWLGYRLATQAPDLAPDAALNPASAEHFRPAGWSPPDPERPR